MTNEGCVHKAGGYEVIPTHKSISIHSLRVSPRYFKHYYYHAMKSRLSRSIKITGEIKPLILPDAIVKLRRK